MAGNDSSDLKRDAGGRIILGGLALSQDMEESIKLLEQIFTDDDTFKTRRFSSKGLNPQPCAAFFLDGMVDSQLIDAYIIQTVNRWNPQADLLPDKLDCLAQQIISANESKISDQLSDMLSAILSGDTMIITQGSNKALLVNTKGFATRGIAEPETEKILRGPREGFTESLMTNLSLIRRRIKSFNLKFIFKSYGEETGTNTCICYLEGVVNQDVLAELKRRLDGLDLDGILDSNYIQEYIRDHPFSPFKTVGSTERPDIIAAKLLEGRVALIVDGTPVALTVPYIFIENFQSNDDYYLNYTAGSIARVLRIIGFLLTVSLPAIYLSLISFHQEMIPTKLLLSIAGAHGGIPFPSYVEALATMVVFEILREAGNRTPSNIGQTLSIVGGLVLGQAAVAARFVSAPMVIVIAFAGITTLMVSRLNVAAIICRFLFLLLSAALGLYGFVFGLAWLLIYLSGLSSFGIPMLADWGSVTYSGQKRDIWLRFPWTMMEKKGRFISWRAPDTNLPGNNPETIDN